MDKLLHSMDIQHHRVGIQALKGAILLVIEDKFLTHLVNILIIQEGNILQELTQLHQVTNFQRQLILNFLLLQQFQLQRLPRLPLHLL